MSAAVPTEQYAAFARRGQEIAAAAIEGITGAFKAYATAVVPQGPRPVDPQAATAASFDLAEKVLKVQREFAIASIALFKDAADTASAQASAAGESLKTRTESATERVVDLATETTRRAATTARNGVSV